MVDGKSGAKVVAGFAMGLLTGFVFFDGTVGAAMKDSTVIAMSTVIIAVCALGASIWQSYVIRTHNVLSSKPAIGFVIRHSREHGIGADISNHGLGPAFVDSVVATKANDSFDLLTETGIQKFALLFSAFGAKSSIACHHMTPGTAIPQGKTMLIDFPRDADFSRNLANAQAMLKKVTVVVTYRCIYDRRHVSTEIFP